jgi:hypothetical protein
LVHETSQEESASTNVEFADLTSDKIGYETNNMKYTQPLLDAVGVGTDEPKEGQEGVVDLTSDKVVTTNTA